MPIELSISTQIVTINMGWSEEVHESRLAASPRRYTHKFLDEDKNKKRPNSSLVPVVVISALIGFLIDWRKKKHRPGGKRLGNTKLSPSEAARQAALTRAAGAGQQAPASSSNKRKRKKKKGKQ